MTFSQFVLNHNLGTIESNSSFKELTTIGCGGQIQYLYTPNSIADLQKVFPFLIQNEIKYFIIGNGSNVLATEKKFDGVVIQLKKLPYEYKKEGNVITCSAFYPTIKLAYDLSKEELGDLSFLGGIPGLLGGAIYNNSGAYKDDIQNHLIDVKYIDGNGNIRSLRKEECAFGYRKSIFHFIDGIIIEARFDIKEIKTIDILNKRTMERKLSQPLECKSMGSIFKNNPLIPAWRVVDALGMRGFQINDAAISAKHANFIINLGNAKGEEILNLIQLIKKRAKLEFGIQLVCEITIL